LSRKLSGSGTAGWSQPAIARLSHAEQRVAAQGRSNKETGAGLAMSRDGRA
jgi:hypothetical protein